MLTAVSPEAWASARVRASMLSWSLLGLSWLAAASDCSAFGLSRIPSAFTIVRSRVLIGPPP
jgi:hypothetical protein